MRVGEDGEENGFREMRSGGGGSTLLGRELGVLEEFKREMGKNWKAAEIILL